MGIFGDLVGGIFGRSASDAAKDAQQAANDAAIVEQRRQFDRVQANTLPQRQVGNLALFQLAQRMGIGPIGGAYDINDTGEFIYTPERGPQTGLGYPQGTTAQQVLAPAQQQQAASRLAFGDGVFGRGAQVAEALRDNINVVKGGAAFDRRFGYAANNIRNTPQFQALLPQEQDAVMLNAYLNAQQMVNGTPEFVRRDIQRDVSPFLRTEQGRDSMSNILSGLEGQNDLGKFVNNLRAPPAPQQQAGQPASQAGGNFSSLAQLSPELQGLDTRFQGLNDTISQPQSRTQAMENRPRTPSLADLVEQAVAGNERLFNQARVQTGQLQDFTRDQFRTDPGYEFARNETMEAVKRQAAASGQTLSPALYTALQDRANGLADQQFGEFSNRIDRRMNLTGDFTNSDRNYGANRSDTSFNQLASLAGSGQVATAQLNNTGSNAANNIGAAWQNSGQAVGQDAIFRGASFQDGLNSIDNSFGISGGFDKLAGRAKTSLANLIG
jgi:hypothetical protein